MLMSKIEKNRENVGVKSRKKSWKHCEAKIEKSRENVGVKNRNRKQQVFSCHIYSESNVYFYMVAFA